MPVLRSRLDPASPEARANHDAMAGLVAGLRERQAAVASRWISALAGKVRTSSFAAACLRITRWCDSVLRA